MMDGCVAAGSGGTVDPCLRYGTVILRFAPALDKGRVEGLVLLESSKTDNINSFGVRLSVAASSFLHI